MSDTRGLKGSVCFKQIQFMLQILCWIVFQKGTKIAVRELQIFTMLLNDLTSTSF